MSKVSICIPTYNNEQYIGKTIESLLNQTHQDLEIVIVDDCSTDNTCAVVKNYRDSRIILYQNTKNLGMSGNWNRSIELATGEFIKLVCADDILYPSCIQDELTVLQSDIGLSMVISDSALINEAEERLGTFKRYPKKGKIKGRLLAKHAMILINYFGMPCAVMFRKSDFKKVGGFSKQYHYILDFALWLELALRGDVYVMGKILNGFRLRDDSNTGQVFTSHGKAYYNEHKLLLDSFKQRLELNTIEYFTSLLSRRLRNFANGIYLKIKVIKK